MSRNLGTNQSTVDALQAEARVLASSALDESKSRAALGALCMWLRFVLLDAYQRTVIASGLPLLPMLTLKAA